MNKLYEVRDCKWNKSENDKYEGSRVVNGLNEYVNVTKINDKYVVTIELEACNGKRITHFNTTYRSICNLIYDLNNPNYLIG